MNGEDGVDGIQNMEGVIRTLGYRESTQCLVLSNHRLSTRKHTSWSVNINHYSNKKFRASRGRLLRGLPRSSMLAGEVEPTITQVAISHSPKHKAIETWKPQIPVLPSALPVRARE